MQIERDRDELSKSLHDIEVCYQKSKKKLERDLGKMEFQVKQVKDTQEKMQIMRIKGLDIVTKEAHRIMPNSLTEQQLHNNLYLDDEEKEKEIDELIKKDLEDADNIFVNLLAAKLSNKNAPA